MIDTLKLSQDLAKAGMDRGQAEALAEGLATGLSNQTVTKAEFTTGLKELESTMIKWMVGLIVPVYALMIGLLLKLSH